MIQDRRKEYRKNYHSFGRIHVGGETLAMICLDVSVGGAMLEVWPGRFITSVADIETLLTDNPHVELYVKDLQMTGQADMVWVKESARGMLIGLALQRAEYGAKKLWRVRRNYRKQQTFTGEILVGNKRLPIQGINISVDGMAVQTGENHGELILGHTVKLILDEGATQALGKIVWINDSGSGFASIGLKYFVFN